MVNKQKYQIGLILIATNKYITFVPNFLNSVQKFFFLNQKKEIFLFSDKKINIDFKGSFTQTKIKHQPWPLITLNRYKLINRHKRIFKNCDYLFYCDVDMLIVSEIKEDILPNEKEKIVATGHPGFFYVKQPKTKIDFFLKKKLPYRKCYKRLRGTYETNSKSTAFVSEQEGDIYYAGGFNGGITKHFLAMAEKLTHNINQDLKKDLIAVWHDESHLNRYLIDNPHKTLTPSYAYPEYENLPFEKKIICLNKKHSEFRIPELSVLMPVYNAEPFLDESITSILNQTYSDFEFIILDDCSTDNSLEIIQNYADKDNRIKILQNKQNKKEAACRNILLKIAKTEFIAWMDADDIISKNRLQIQLAFLKNNPSVDIVGSQMNLFGTTSSTTHFPLSDYEIKSYLLLSCPLSNPSTVFRMGKIRKHKLLYNENLASAVDFQFWADALPFVNFTNIDKVLLKYRIHQQQESTTNLKKQQLCHLEIVKNHLSKFNLKINDKFILLMLEKNKKLTIKDLQILKPEINKILQIKNFYQYSNGVDKKTIFKIFYSGFCRKAGIKGKLFFIKNFGIKNYLKVKTW